MALFKTLKLAKQAMGADAIRQGLEAGRASLTVDPEKRLAALTPEQRQAHDEAVAAMASGEVVAAATGVRTEMFERELGRRALRGAAGEHVYGPMPVEVATIETSMAASKEQLKDVLRNPFGTRKAPAPAGASTDPADRDRQAASERAARDAARAPYLAPDRTTPVSTRILTKTKDQVEEVEAALGRLGLSARPDLVFGVFRVPDHIGGTVLRKGSRLVEWEVVHAAASGLPPAEHATSAGFDAQQRWALRRDGERAPLDEDLALAYLGMAGIGPEQCLGIARTLEVRDHGGGEGQMSATFSFVTGVRVFHASRAASGAGVGAYDRMAGERPLAVPEVDGVRIEVLNWGAVARAVRPETHRRPLVPSPFPHLPSTAGELLEAYLEVVGIAPVDSYGVQVTEDAPRDIAGVTRKGPMTISTNRGDEQPCADGELRRRLTGGSRVVVVHRERPAHEAGRARWAAYERDVLDAALSNGTALRPVVQGPGITERGVLGRLVRGAEFVGDLVDGFDGDDPLGDVPPYRYCWPPAR